MAYLDLVAWNGIGYSCLQSYRMFPERGNLRSHFAIATASGIHSQ